MVEPIRKSIIELKNLEQYIEYSIADINKQRQWIEERNQEYSNICEENKALKNEIEMLKAELEKLKANGKESTTDISSSGD